MSELKPCPYCGKPGKIDCNDDTGWWYGYCDMCSYDGPSDLGRSGAIKAWNTRPIEDALRACIEDARDVIGRGVDLMTSDQLGQWAGVRSWLEMAPYTPEMVKEE